MATKEDAAKPTASSGNPDVRRAIGARLSILARQTRRLFDGQISKLGITRAQWTTIVAVARHPGANQRSIADVLEMSEASAGRVIDRLCTEGLMSRDKRDDDRRARCVALTPKASLLLGEFGTVAKRCEETIFAGFSDAEVEELEGLLDRLYTNLTG